ncbi:hypothetical protein VM1G_09460 [Cytospora mali]|uniref:Uncharacterized protein n=1 Tax=Cytospora mali TaxID=578113 RepID=A0A194WCY3_CYTMA|nr:hypothetical protein VM1G_09460 [Valsa mali]
MPEVLAALVDKPLPGPPPRHHKTTQPRHAMPPRGLQDSIHNPRTPTNSSSNSKNNTNRNTGNSISTRGSTDHSKPRRTRGDSSSSSSHHAGEQQINRSSNTSNGTLARSVVSSTSGADTIINISRDDSANRAVGSGPNRSSVNSKDEQPPQHHHQRRSTRSSTNTNNTTTTTTANGGLNPSYQAKLEIMRANTQHLLHAYPSPAPSNGSFDSQPASPALLGQFQELQRQIQSLKAKNMKLGAENRNLAAVKGAHEATIDGLRDQLRAKEAEQAQLVEQFCVETAQRDEELSRLQEDVSVLTGEKKALVGRVAELEHLQQHAQGAQRKHMPVIVDCSGPCILSTPSPSTYRGSESHSESGDHAASSSPLVRSSSNNTPSLYTPFSSRTRDEATVAPLYTTTPSPSVRVRWRQRRPSLADSQGTSPSFVEDELFALSDQLAVHYERYSKEYQAMTAQLAVLAEDKAQLEKDLAVAREQQVALASRNRDLEAKVTSQLSLVQSSMAPIPDLPVLTYAKPGSVWFDRVKSSFKYWGLFEFISQPDVAGSPSDPARESRRLRAAVLLKRAIEDDILDDVMYLQSQRSITSAPSSSSGSSTSSSPRATQIPELESPYFLFQTITTLKRTVPTSLMDLNWLDRINDSDFENIEGFASLVLCLDRRHSKLYGTSVDHYDALVPKIQENMSKRFPDLEKPLADLTSTPTPKKWWHLSLWMSKIVKRRQGRTSSDDS